MNNEIVASVDATFNNNLSLDADLGVVTERPSPVIKINISNDGNNTATVTNLDTFEQFRQIVFSKQERVVLAEVNTGSGNVDYTFNSILYYTGDYHTSRDENENEAYIMSFLGIIHSVTHQFPSGGITPSEKLVTITFDNSLTGKYKEVSITSAKDIYYYNASFPSPVPFNVKDALDKLQTNKFEKPVEMGKTLSAGQTSLQFVVQGMSDKTIDVYVDPAFSNVVPTKTTVVGNVLTLTFPVQSTNMPVKVRLS